MKTAKDYLRAQVGPEPTAFVTHAAALAAVQAALDEAGTVGQQLRQALAEYFEPAWPEPAPTNAPPIRLGQIPRPNVFPPACPRCLQRGADCLCEQPPF